jgi:hypothetical protein
MNKHELVQTKPVVATRALPTASLAPFAPKLVETIERSASRKAEATTTAARQCAYELILRLNPA